MSLILITMNKITNYIPQYVNVCLFAVDFAIYYKNKNTATIKQELQHFTKQLQNWSKSTCLQFSKCKTKMMFFTKLTRRVIKFVIKINIKRIDYVTSIKFLEMTLVLHLIWKQHLEHLKRECYKRLTLLNA